MDSQDVTLVSRDNKQIKTHKVEVQEKDPIDFIQDVEAKVETEDDEEVAVNDIKIKKVTYNMDEVKQVKKIKSNLERKTYEFKVEQTPKGGATNITMNPAPFLILLKYMETIRLGQKSRRVKVIATIKENMELRESKNMKVHTKIVMELQLNQTPGAKTKPTVHLFPGDAKVEIQGSNAAQERAANEYFVPLLKKLLKGNEIVVENIKKAIAETKEESKKRKPRQITLDCNLCECKFMSESDLRCHRARIHAITIVSPSASPPSKKDKPNEAHVDEFKCAMCAVKCKTAKEMESHMKQHQCAVVLECELCAVKCKSPDQLDIHMKQHQSIDEFEREMCAVKWKTSSLLESHMKQHKGPVEFNCEMCASKCKTSDQLEIHMKQHQSVDELECEMCAVKFKTSNLMKTHMKQHQRVVELECEMCTVKCKTSDQLESHMRQHQIHSEVKCEICADKFETTSQLESHMKLHHSFAPALGPLGKGKNQPNESMELEESPEEKTKYAEVMSNEMDNEDSRAEKVEEVMVEEEKTEEVKLPETTLEEKEQEYMNEQAFQHLMRMPEFKDQGTDTKELQLEAGVQNKAEFESLWVKYMQCKIDMEYLTTEKELKETELEIELETVKKERNEMRNMK